jgi:hypothetical protein
MSSVSKATSVCVSSSIWRKRWIMFLSIESGTGVTEPFDSSVTVSGIVPSSICFAIRFVMSAIESPVRVRIAAIIDTGHVASVYRNRKIVIADWYEGQTTMTPVHRLVIVFSTEQ